ncbi:hypothetical protein PHJA_002403900 [Phtheirospermum japonicum]|uniref:Secreted protein n=1 Tax=Phtheirospermum japonicum TaxID=374723 RepID=A0A830CYE8_9LAMI|nr:hypothetical protein PHJA_002403900 [Phtheirospermum japonicum]
MEMSCQQMLLWHISWSWSRAAMSSCVTLRDTSQVRIAIKITTMTDVERMRTYTPLKLRPKATPSCNSASGSASSNSIRS